MEMHIPDLTRHGLEGQCRHGHVCTEFADLHRHRDTVVYVGWLDSEQGFPTGHVPEDVMERLNGFAVFGRVNAMRSGTDCPLCPPHDGGKGRQFPRASSAGKSIALGAAEIWVRGNDSIVYCCPDLICHYISVHGYRPPHELVEAVLRAPDPVPTPHERPC